MTQPLSTTSGPSSTPLLPSSVGGQSSSSSNPGTSNATPHMMNAQPGINGTMRHDVNGAGPSAKNNTTWEGDFMCVQKHQWVLSCPHQNIQDLRAPCASFVSVFRLHIYMRDYLQKRGFVKTAQSLMMEAEITDDAGPPIKSDQGLLFESVFHLA